MGPLLPTMQLLQFDWKSLYGEDSSSTGLDSNPNILLRNLRRHVHRQIYGFMPANKCYQCVTCLNQRYFKSLAPALSVQGRNALWREASYESKTICQIIFPEQSHYAFSYQEEQNVPRVLPQTCTIGQDFGWYGRKLLISIFHSAVNCEKGVSIRRSTRFIVH